MSITLYVIILIIGSMTLSRKVRELATSIKAKNKDKIKVDVFFLFLTILIIAFLILIDILSKQQA